MLRSFKAALASGKGFSVLAVESRSADLAHGQRLLDEPLGLGIAAELVPDAAIDEGVARADVVLVGADKLFPSGDVVNGRPSLAVADRARGAIPFYVVCEGFKMDGDPAIEEGFDLVPASLVTAVLTETQP